MSLQVTASHAQSLSLVLNRTKLPHGEQRQIDLGLPHMSLARLSRTQLVLLCELCEQWLGLLRMLLRARLHMSLEQQRHARAHLLHTW